MLVLELKIVPTDTTKIRSIGKITIFSVGGSENIGDYIANFYDEYGDKIAATRHYGHIRNHGAWALIADMLPKLIHQNFAKIQKYEVETKTMKGE